MAQTVTFPSTEQAWKELSESAVKLRQQLLQLPIMSAQKTLKYMTPRVGIRVAETVGTLDGNMQFGPYSATREDNEDVNISARTLNVFLGSVVKNFSPNDIYKSVWGPKYLHGEEMKRTDITLAVLSLLSKKLGENLNNSLWGAVRKDDGDKTKDLFNGWDTIAKKELTAGKLSEEAGNLINISKITNENAYDTLRAICKAANEQLLDEDELLLFCPREVLWAYEEDYKATTGGTAYNQTFKKTTIEGFDNVTFVPLGNKRTSPFIQLTTKKNMLYGVDQISDMENVEVARFKAFVLQFIATMFFGVEYESIAPERILFATVDGSQSIV